MGFILGMDTGGTFTDAVLLDQDKKTILKKAKAPTTKEDLCIGIRASLEALDFEAMSDIGLVCLSTTLATNSIVEGKGCRVGLVITGKAPYGDLPEAVIVNAGGALDITGRLREELDEDAARKAIAELKGKVDAIAISGYACVRNPEHELTVRRIAREELGIPVVCSHELTCELGYYERTVTVILNARLIPLIKRLIADTRICLEEKGVKAPIMVVRGDGSYMESTYAMERPVETILSGPAASVKGAMFLSQLKDGTIFDLGGTTSDLAMLKNGKVDISLEGAKVGGWRTRVRAIDVFTRGLGGDSRIHISEDGEIRFGPDKIIPVSYASANGLSEDTYDIGFTPTDLAHILGIYNAWDTSAAEIYLMKLADRRRTKKECLLNQMMEAFQKAVISTIEDSGKLLPNAPIAALGAPTEAWMPILLKDSEYKLVVPKHSEVANAVGAAVGEIEEVVKVLIRYDEVSGKYVTYSKWQRREFDDLNEAKEVCLREAKQHALEEAKKCGCDAPRLLSDMRDAYCDTYDCVHRNYVETVINVIAVGPPRFL